MLLGRRLTGHLFMVWKDEASIVGSRGSDERNVSPKRNRHLQIEYPPSSIIPLDRPSRRGVILRPAPYRKIPCYHGFPSSSSDFNTYGYFFKTQIY